LMPHSAKISRTPFPFDYRFSRREVPEGIVREKAKTSQ
jgi:hypothetical protein